MKRSQKKIITVRSRIIRYMRLSKRIPQTAAALVAGCSYQAIGHYEAGRMGISEDRLEKLLLAYGFTRLEFDEYVNGKPIPFISLKDECAQMIEQIESEDKLKALVGLLKNLGS